MPRPLDRNRQLRMFKHSHVKLANVALHCVVAGESGTPIVLLHGWPQTWLEWKKVMPQLAKRHRAIAIDLRGLGDSTRPADGDYSKLAAAADIAQLIEALDLGPVHLVGHDMGAAVAYALAATRPDLVLDLVALDMLLPGFGLEQVMDCSQGQGLWHFPFHQAEGVAEMLVEGRERAYLNWFFTHQAARPGAVSDDDLSAYALAYSGRDRLSAGFGYYRAVFKDAQTNQRLAATKLSMPVLALGGETGAGDYVGASFAQVASSVVAEVVPACGHWIADECPDWLSQRLMQFYRSEVGVQ
jgi:pimeloyl-ACP methyl ester carboxylesterase